jgi:hypothetical protein
MTIIYSFDCAIKNLGFCCIEIDNEWRNKTAKLINSLNTFYENIPENKQELTQKMTSLIKQTDQLISNRLIIKYINVFDLVPEGKASATKFQEILKRLKYVIYCLEKQLPPPDVVLIEYQMNINDKARGVSRYIEEHFTAIGCSLDTDSITYALDNFPLIGAEIPTNQLLCSVHIVAPGLKNMYPIDKSIAGNYDKFIEKHIRNYEANKAHSVHHFLHYLKSFGLLSIIKNCPNKLDDLADAFMMAYAWCTKNKLL